MFINSSTDLLWTHTTTDTERAHDLLVSSEEKCLSSGGVVEGGVYPIFGKPSAHFFQTLGVARVQNGFSEDPVLVPCREVEATSRRYERSGRGFKVLSVFHPNVKDGLTFKKDKVPIFSFKGSIDVIGQPSPKVTNRHGVSVQHATVSHSPEPLILSKRGKKKNLLKDK